MNHGEDQMMNIEFNLLARVYKEHFEKLTPTDRVLANKWFSRLREFNIQPEDMKPRNEILAAMILQMQMRALTVPFSTFPKFKNLSEVQVAEFTAENIFPDDFKLPPAATKPGAFMVSPVPKCGAYCYMAYCYMAVISKPRDRE